MGRLDSAVCTTAGGAWCRAAFVLIGGFPATDPGGFRARCGGRQTIVMLRPGQVDRITALLGEGLPRREVARRAGVSRQSVDRVARGTWTGFTRGPPKAVDAPTAGQEGAHVRCPGCGGKVAPPCRACDVRAVAARNKRRRKPRGPETEYELRLELAKEHRRRYEAVRRAKLSAMAEAWDDLTRADLAADDGGDTEPTEADLQEVDDEAIRPE